MQDNWQRVTLEYLADVIDPQPDHRAPRFVEGGFSYVGIGDIDVDGHIRHEQCRKVSEAAVEKQERAFTIEYEDIAFGKVGTVGKVVYLKEQGRYAVSATLVIIKPKEIVDRHFLFHLLQSHQTTENIILRQTGTTRATLGIQQIRAFEYVIPSLLEQKFIAEILDAIDETIAHTASIIAKLKQIKAGLLHDLLTRGLDENGELRDAIAHPEQFKDSPLGQIPKDWDVNYLERILTGIDAGKSPDCPDIPAQLNEWGVLKVSAVRPDGFRSEENKVILNSGYINPDYEVKDGNLLITRANTYELVGLTCFVKNSSPRLLLSDKTLRLNVNYKFVSEEFLFYILQMSCVRRQIEANATGSSAGMKNISQNIIKKLLIPLPKTTAEQEKIISILNTNDTRIREEEAYLEKLKLHKKGLMHDLLTGKVRVNQINTSALLSV